MLKGGRFYESALIILLSVLLSALVFFYSRVFLYTSIFVLLGILLLYFYVKIRNFLLIYLFVIMVFPLSIYAKPPISYGINDYHIIGGYILLLVIFAFKVFFTSSDIRKQRQRIPISFIFLESIVIIFTVVGFLKGFKSEWLLRESFYLSIYFLTYFLVDFSSVKDFVSKFEKIIFIASVIILIEYCLRYYWLFTHFDLRRVVSQQANIALFAFPLAFFALFSQQSAMERFIRITAVLSCMLLAILSLQRSLWLIMFADIILGFAYFLFSLGVNKETAKKIIVILLIIALLTTIVMTVMNKYFDIVKLLRSRLRTLTEENLTEDKALNVRAEDFAEVKRMIQRDSFLGAGLGAPIFQKNTGLHKEVIDNSYAVLIFKIGILGLAMLLLIYFGAIKDSLSILLVRKTEYLYFAIPVGLINYLVISASSSAMFFYRFNVLAGIFIVLVLKSVTEGKCK
ncbi:MAG: hypothetical protein AB7T10_01905 [bacterium]